MQARELFNELQFLNCLSAQEFVGMLAVIKVSFFRLLFVMLLGNFCYAVSNHISISRVTVFSYNKNFYAGCNPIYLLNSLLFFLIARSLML